MARITKIRFQHTGKQEGCLCDRCGQYITNIWSVTYADGITMKFGIDCYEKLNKESNLTSYGQKLLKKTLKRIEDHERRLAAEKELTKETDIRYQNEQEQWSSQSYWYGRPWEEYHKWMIEEFWPARFEDDQKTIDRFAKVNFKR